MRYTSVWLRGAFTALALGASDANAQSPSIADHYRAYTEALQNGDINTAATAAEAALRASEQRDGDGGRTAVLALNLARVRLQLAQWPEARVAAQRAISLTEAHGAESGVDPTMARLLLGRAWLGAEGRPGALHLSDVLENAANRTDLIGDRYDAADDLGLWALQMHDYLLARRAWAAAATVAGGAPYPADFALGRARAYEGLAIALQWFSRETTPSRLIVNEVRERFAEAHPLLQRYALLDAPDGQLTAAQDVYALMLAWDTALWSKLASDNRANWHLEQLEANPTVVEGTPVCAVDLQRSAISYPADNAARSQIGAVIVRLRFDAAGTMLSSDLAASVGDEDFPQAVANSVRTWTARVTPTAPAGCVVPPVVFVPVAFAFR